MPDDKSVTELLRDWGSDEQARDRVCTLLFDELKRVARSQMRGERVGHTLQPTALVNEALMRLFRSADEVDWKDRGHFLGFAARAMRNVLIDWARRKNAKKRGGGNAHYSLEEYDCVSDDQLDREIAIHELLEKLEETYPLEAKVAERSYYGGGKPAEIAESLKTVDDIEITSKEVEQCLKFARAWIHSELHS